MKTKRAILIGIIIWIIAIFFYSVSYFTPILSNADTQANVVLFIIVIPLVWKGCFYYYKNNSKTHGLKIGLMMLLTSIALDALITVPVFMIPNGVNHFSFFTTLEFWVIALEFLIVATIYWYTQVNTYKKFSK